MLDCLSEFVRIPEVDHIFKEFLRTLKAMFWEFKDYSWKVFSYAFSTSFIKHAIKIATTNCIRRTQIYTLTLFQLEGSQGEATSKLLKAPFSNSSTFDDFQDLYEPWLVIKTKARFTLMQ